MQSENDLEASLSLHFAFNEAYVFRTMNSINNNLLAIARHPNPAQAERGWLSILATATAVASR